MTPCYETEKGNGAASEEFQVDVTEKIDQEASLMCNLSDGQKYKAFYQ